MILGDKLSSRGVMDPFLGMWMGNMVMGFVGIVLTIKTNSETASIARLKVRILRRFRK